LNRATENLGAIVDLLERGWETDATALLRTLMDIYIDVRYIRTDRDNLLERFYDYAIVGGLWKKETIAAVYGISVDDQLRREYDLKKEHVREGIPDAAAFIASYRAEVDRAQARWDFRRSGWAALDTLSKCRRVRTAGDDPGGEMETVYELVYRMASEALHSGIGGALRGVRVDGSTATLEHAARSPRESAILTLTFSSLFHMKVMDHVNQELGLGLEPELLRLDARLKVLKGPARVVGSP
jgi:hypothetical protein